MKIFFDVDGVLIDGWHANAELRRPWDITINEDLGVDRATFQRLFFGTPGNRSKTPMFECVSGRRDLKTALAEVLPQVGYLGSVDGFTRYWFEKDSNLNARVISLVSELHRASDIKLYVATGQEHHRARYLWNDLGFPNSLTAFSTALRLDTPRMIFASLKPSTPRLKSPTMNARYSSTISLKS